MDRTYPPLGILTLADPERAKGRLAAHTLRSPQGGSITNSVEVPKNSADWYRRGLDEMERDPDYTSAVERMKQQGDAASRAMVLALAAREAGPEFDNISRYFLNRTRVEPMKMQGATIDAQGNVIRDPNFQRERQAEIFMRRGDVAAKDEGARAEAERRAAERAEDRAQRFALAQLAAGSRTSSEPLVTVVDPDTGQPVLMPRSQAAGMQPFQAPKAGDDGKARQAAADRQSALDVYRTARTGLMEGLAGSSTGPIMGRIPAVTSAQQIAQGGVAAMAPVLKQMFRSAGEGTFTDRDQQLLLDMVPTRTDTPEAAKAKIANIDRIVEAKLGQGAAVNQSGGGGYTWAPQPGMGTPAFNPSQSSAGQWSIKRVN